MKLVLDMGNQLARDRLARGNSNKCCFRQEPRNPNLQAVSFSVVSNRSRRWGKEVSYG